MTEPMDDDGVIDYLRATAELCAAIEGQAAAPRCRLTVCPPARPGRVEAAWAAVYCTVVIAALVAPLVIRLAIGTISSGAAMGWDFDWPGTA